MLSPRRLVLITVLLGPCVLGKPAAAAPTGTGPWRVAEAVGSPKWLSFGATQRTRFEQLWNQFRPGAPGDDRGLLLRTTLHAELRLLPLLVGGELADSRLYLADDNAPLNTSLINTLEPLQAYLGAELEDIFVTGDAARIRAGRLTMNFGSRRLLARNRYRNTINAFTGLELWWRGPAGDLARALVAMPIERRPGGDTSLEDNEIEIDRERTNTLFWALFYRSRPLWTLQGELYLYGLHERDAEGRASANRNLLTPGLRVVRPPTRGAVDVDLELAVQGGTSRASRADDDITDLDHLALLVHAAVGYTLALPWSPRLLAQYHYASGDADPTDGRNGRFDTLFGARRFEYGPTGIYGAFARSNIHSLCLRALARPLPSIDAFFAYRPVWLAQERDAWTTSGIRDASGAAGSFVGHQIEARFRWRILPGNVTLDLGFARTWLGRMPTRAPNAANNGNPLYIYTQLALEI